jgi:ABC-type branched-subunit amino acid transport system substrate-binding protein
MQETVRNDHNIPEALPIDLKFIVYDTGSKPQDAILMAQKLMHTDKVLCIIGPFLSTECEGLPGRESG